MPVPTRPDTTAVTWTLSRRMLGVRGAIRPCRAMASLTDVPTLPRMESETTPVVQPSVFTSFTPMMRSPT